MPKILLLIILVIVALFGASVIKDKADEKKKFLQNEALIKQTNDCLNQGNWDCAEKNVRTLLKETPNDTNLQLHLAGILLEKGSYSDCIEHIDSLKFQSPTAEKIKEKATQLAKEEGELQIEDSRHFRLEFDGTPSKTDIYEALTVLEVAYDSLGRLFNFYPEKRIHLVLYQSKEFQGSSSRPEWVGAIFDGKLRISLSAMKHREIYRPMIIHELTHAFIHSITLGQIPLWLNEGIAQEVDGSELSERPAGAPPTLEALTHSFVKVRERETALKLYWYSLAMVKEMLSASIHFSDLAKILQIIGEKGINEALSPYGLSAEKLLEKVSH